MDISRFGRNSFVTHTTGLKERIQKAEKEKRKMREVKFRGRRKDNGEWVYGGFTQTPEVVFIIDYSVIVQKAQDGYPTVYDVVEVIPESVAQFICKDKHGKDIYRGDETNLGIALTSFESWVWTYTKDHSTYHWHTSCIIDIELIGETKDE